MELIYKIFIEPFQYEFMQRAMLASVIVGITCGLVGTFIMLRRLSLIGDALAHAVLPGVIIGFIIAGKGQLAMFIGAVFSGLVTSLLIGFVSRNSKIKEDTAIGVVFTGFFALGVLMVSQLKNVHIDLSSYLFGDILGVSSDDLVLSGLIAILVFVTVIIFYRQLLVTSFDPTMAAVMGLSTGLVHYLLMGLLSMTIVASLQSVGVILVVAMLITPAATAYLLTDRLHKMLIYSVMIGIFTATVGLFFSYHFNFASGASMVIFGMLIFLFTLIFSPTQGILSRYIKKRKIAEKNLAQDALKNLFKNCIDHHQLKIIREVIDISDLKNLLGSRGKKFKKALANLKKEDLISIEGDQIRITEKGKSFALRLIRSHRLWETYLNHETNMNLDIIHSSAEELEHLLTDELLDEIDLELGFPKFDPHGSPIPQKN